MSCHAWDDIAPPRWYSLVLRQLAGIAFPRLQRYHFTDPQCARGGCVDLGSHLLASGFWSF